MSIYFRNLYTHLAHTNHQAPTTPSQSLNTKWLFTRDSRVNKYGKFGRGTKKKIISKVRDELEDGNAGDDGGENQGSGDDNHEEKNRDKEINESRLMEIVRERVAEEGLSEDDEDGVCVSLLSV